MKRIFILFLVFFVFFSCKKKNDKTPVAEIDGVYLYKEDLKKILPNNLSYEDSIAFVENYINQWIEEQILLKEAKTYIPEEKLQEINQKVKDFEKSLIIFEIKQEILKKNLDTQITDNEINEYYLAHKQELVADQPYIKGIFLKVPKSLNINQIKQQLLNSEITEQLQLFEEINNAGGSVKDFTNTWQPLINFGFSQNEVAGKILAEKTDDKFYYLLKINDLIKQNDVLPLELCQNKIKKIILNKRSAEVLEKYIGQKYKNMTENGQIKLF